MPSELDLASTTYQLGKLLEFDPEKERFVGNEAANELLSREYREPFVVPADVLTGRCCSTGGSTAEQPPKGVRSWARLPARVEARMANMYQQAGDIQTANDCDDQGDYGQPSRRRRAGYSAAWAAWTRLTRPTANPRLMGKL